MTESDSVFTNMPSFDVEETPGTQDVQKLLSSRMNVEYRQLEMCSDIAVCTDIALMKPQN